LKLALLSDLHACVRDAGVERRQVGVQVGKQCKFQRTVSSSMDGAGLMPFVGLVVIDMIVDMVIETGRSGFAQ